MPLPGAIFLSIVISIRTGRPYAASMARRAGVITLSSTFSGRFIPLRLRISNPSAPSSAPISSKSPTPSSVRPITSKPQPRFATVPGAKTRIYFFITESSLNKWTVITCRPAVFAAYRRVYKPDPIPDPSLSEGLSAATQRNQRPRRPAGNVCRLNYLIVTFFPLRQPWPEVHTEYADGLLTIEPPQGW